MDKFDAAEILKDGVAKVSTRLANLTDVQLKDLHDAEEKGEKRTTLLAAIHREVNSRVELAKGEDVETSDVDVSGGEATARQDGMVHDVTGSIADPANDDDREAFSQRAEDPDDEDDGGAGDGDDDEGAGDPIESDADFLQRVGADGVKWAREFLAMNFDPGQIDEGLMVGWFANAIEAGRRAGETNVEELREKVGDLESQLAEQNGTDPSGAPLYSQVQLDSALAGLRTDMEKAADARVDEAVKAATAKPRPKTKAAKPLSIDGDADLTKARDHASMVQLVDTDDVPIAELPALAFDQGAYRYEGGRALVLTRPIDVQRGIPQREVAAAFLSVDGKVLGKAVLATPFAVGGGLATQLPSGTLSFERVAIDTAATPLAA